MRRTLSERIWSSGQRSLSAKSAGRWFLDTPVFHYFPVSAVVLGTAEFEDYQNHLAGLDRNRGAFCVSADRRQFLG